MQLLRHESGRAFANATLVVCKREDVHVLMRVGLAPKRRSSTERRPHVARRIAAPVKRRACAGCLVADGNTIKAPENGSISENRGWSSVESVCLSCLRDPRHRHRATASAVARRRGVHSLYPLGFAMNEAQRQRTRFRANALTAAFMLVIGAGAAGLSVQPTCWRPVCTSRCWRPLRV